LIELTGKLKHATIIPLIGGEAIASTNVFGDRPDYIMTYSPFAANERHLLNYWNHEVPYHVLDDGGRHPHSVDVVSSVCPCAGLSMLSHGFGDHNVNNRWMLESARYVLGDVRPAVFWGENAPGLAGKIGTNIREQLIAIGRELGYTMTFYRTKSLLHGVPQVRERTFYFFWRGDRTPLLNYYSRQYTPIEDVFTSVTSNFQMEPINPKTPSEDPYYRYLLEVVYGGITHREFFDARTDSGGVAAIDAKSLIERAGHSYETIGAWMGKNGYPREVERCARMGAKLASGKNIMRRGTIVPKGYIGAFVGHYPTCLTHPYEDRYVTYREAMTIMGLPSDFELLDPERSTNHICQNVPVRTAEDMATEVLAVLNDERPWVDSDLVFQYNTSRTHEIRGRDSKSSLIDFLT
jgi:site-specific DNA-cytosine methylase